MPVRVMRAISAAYSAAQANRRQHELPQRSPTGRGKDRNHEHEQHDRQARRSRSSAARCRPSPATSAPHRPPSRDTAADTMPAVSPSVSANASARMPSARRDRQTLGDHLVHGEIVQPHAQAQVAAHDVSQFDASTARRAADRAGSGRLMFSSISGGRLRSLEYGPPGTARISRNETVNTIHSVTIMPRQPPHDEPDHWHRLHEFVRARRRWRRPCGSIQIASQRMHVLQIVVEAADVRPHQVPRHVEVDRE